MSSRSDGATGPSGLGRIDIQENTVKGFVLFHRCSSQVASKNAFANVARAQFEASPLLAPRLAIQVIREKTPETECNDGSSVCTRAPVK